MSDPRLPPGVHECPRCGYIGMGSLHECGRFCNECGCRLGRKEEDICKECAERIAQEIREHGND